MNNQGDPVMSKTMPQDRKKATTKNSKNASAKFIAPPYYRLSGLKQLESSNEKF